jgi:GNAT superfamily N-acetyltransferase
VPAPQPRTIIPADALTEEQRKHLFFFEEDVFGLAALGLAWEPKTRFFTVHVAGRLVANAGVVARTVDVAGVPVRVAGLGGVVTRPEARGAGHAGAAVAAATEYARDTLRAEFGMLFCLPRLMPFYARMGWEPVAEPVTIEQPGGPVPSPLVVMVKPLDGRPWPPGAVSLNGRPW